MNNVIDLGAYREAKRSVDREEILDKLLELKNEKRLRDLRDKIENRNRSEDIQERIKRLKDSINRVDALIEEKGKQ